MVGAGCKGEKPGTPPVSTGSKGRTVGEAEGGPSKRTQSGTPEAADANPPMPERLVALEDNTVQQEELLRAGKDALARDDTDKAVAAFEELSSTGPMSGDRVSGAIALADLLMDRGQSAKAIGRLEPIVQRAPPIPELAYMLGRCYKEVGKREKAILAYQEALRLQPLLLQAHIEIGGLQQERGETELSAQAFLYYERSIYRYGKILEDAAAHPTDKIKICEAFSFLPDDRAAEALIGALSDRNAKVRVAAAEAVGEVGTHPMLPRLREARAVAADDAELAQTLEAAISKIEATPANAEERIGPTFQGSKETGDDGDAGIRAGDADTGPEPGK